MVSVGLVDEAYEVLIMDELERIKRVLKGDEWIKLCAIYGECRDVKRLDKRTMIAHGGLQKEFVEVNPASKRLRYVKDVNIDKLIKELGLALEDIA